MNSPAADIEITEELVAELIAEQHPDLADQSIRFLSEGWDNAQYRLGQDLIVRIPRREVAACLIEHEQEWLPQLAPTITLPIPAPVRIGQPSHTFAWHWSICPWIPGQDALSAPVRGSSTAARQLADFLNELHHPAPINAPENPYRGVPLADRSDRTLTSADAGLAAGMLTKAEHGRILQHWDIMVKASSYDGPAIWLHGDLHPGNITTTSDGTSDSESSTRIISGIIDWGDITSGDPATDIGVLWSLFDAERRHEALQILDRDQATIDRARTWAMSIGVMLLANSGDRPSYAALGRRNVDEVLAEIS